MVSSIRMVYDNWFLSEPALHAILCSHHIVENPSLSCSVRTGAGKIEYNPDLISSLPYSKVEELLKVEVVRILLGHPYMRQPVGVSGEILTLASDITISNYYRFDDVALDTARQHGLPTGKYYEWYAHELNGDEPQNDGEADSKYGEGAQKISPQLSSEGELDSSKKEQSELWCGDELVMAQIHMTTARITQWGSLPQPLVEGILASRTARADYKRILAHFRQTTLSSYRRLTRMRPNRRTDLLQMGSIYQMRSRILVAVDTSGSVSDSDLSRFYGLIGNLYRHCSAIVDTVQFDVALAEIVPIKRAPRKIVVTQRGGTSFQPIVDMASSAGFEYDGVVVLTDGLAPQPLVPKRFHVPIMWAIVQSGMQLPKWLLQSPHCILPTN